MPLPFSRRQKQPPEAFKHSNVEIVGLTRIATVSSIASDATTDNQPGAGRTVGLLYSWLGSGLEDTLNRRAERLGVGNNAAESLDGRGLARIKTISSIDSDATIDNQPGAGRTVGLFLAWLGSKVEKTLNKRALQLGFDPKAIAEEICRLAGHAICWGYVYCVPDRRLSQSETKALRRLCKTLIKHARSHVIENQLLALEEIIRLVVKDPRVRAILAGCKLNRLITHYDEPDLLLKTQKALSAIEFSNVHRVWEPIILCISTDIDQKSIESLEGDFSESIRNPLTIFLSARYYEHSLNFGFHEEIPPSLRPLLERFRDLYIEFASQYPESIEWSTLRSCICKPQSWDHFYDSRIDSRSPGIANDHILRLALNLDASIFFDQISSFLVQNFPGPEVYLFADHQGIISIDCMDGSSLSNVESFISLGMLYEICSHITRSSNYYIHISCVDYLRDDTKRLLKGSIFFEKPLLTYFILISHISRRPSLIEDDTLRDMCMPLISLLKSDCTHDRALANTLVAKFCASDRYCKRAAVRAAQEISMDLDLSLSRTLIPTIANGCTEVKLTSEAAYLSTPSILFRISDTLCGRYCIAEGEYRYFAMGIGAKWIRSLCRWHPHDENIRVDELHLGQYALFVEVDGVKEPFRAAGHYPILAFQSTEESARKYYIARVGDSYTHVEDGARYVTYNRADRTSAFEEERVSKFEVLVLRYDPEDRWYEKEEGELIDETGNLGWKNIYTQEVVSLADSLSWFP